MYFLCGLVPFGDKPPVTEIIKYPADIGMNAWLENDGGKPPKFIPHTLFDSPQSYGARSLCAADMDNDGDLDIVACFYSGDTFDSGLVMWYENDGARPPRFTAHTLAKTWEPRFNSLDVADIDGDGWQDVVMGTPYEGTKWFKNSHSKTQPFAEYPVSGNKGQVRVADLNGDAKPDVLIGFSWCRNLGGTPTSFTTHLLAPDFHPSDINNYGEVAVGDLDRDGHLDAISYNYDSAVNRRQAQLTALFNDGQAAPGFASVPLGNHYESPTLGDLNGDGNLDVVSSWSKSLYHYRNQAVLAPLTVLTPTELGRSYRSGNKMDIYWRSDPKTAGTAVRLELWRGNAKVASLGSSWSATGQGHAQITLPLVASGWNYQIKAVSSYAPGQYWDFSDEPFAIRGRGNAAAPEAWASYP